LNSSLPLEILGYINKLMEGNIMKNRWKIAFFSLLAGAIIIPIIILQILFPESNLHLDKQKELHKGGIEVFEIHTNKKQLNYLINDQLNELKKGRTDIDYFIEIDDEISLKGYITFFNNKVEFEMIFEPLVQENGNLLLKEKGIKLGLVNLPGDKILEFIEGSTDLPKWVQINADKEDILLELTQIEFRKDMYIKANKINLKNDDIRFKVFYY
jgi:uncharacterized protein YpmS